MARQSKKPARGDDPRRRLASVSVLLSDPAIEALIARHGRAVVMTAIRSVLAGYRRTLRRGDPAPEIGAIVRGVSAAA